MRKRSGLYAIVSADGGRRVLVARTSSGASLPFVSMAPGDWSRVDGRETRGLTRATRAVEHGTGLPVTMLYATEWPPGREDAHRVLRVYAFECADIAASPAAGYDWADGPVDWARPFMTAAVAAHVAVSGAESQPVPWWAPGWAQGAVAWLDERLEALGRRRVGAVEPIKNDWQSCVMRARTNGGDVYLKALAAPATQELAILRDLVPPGMNVPVASAMDAGGGLLLTEDVRGIDPTECDPGALTGDDVRDYARGYAELQQAVGPVASDAVFDCRLARMPEMYADVIHDLPVLLADAEGPPSAQEAAELRELAPVVAAACRDADEGGVHPHLVHGDLDGNSVITPEGPVAFDWATAYVSHPFLDVFEFPYFHRVVTGLPVPDAAADHYLAAWAGHGSETDLRRMLARLRRLQRMPWLLWSAHAIRHLRVATSHLPHLPYSPIASSIRDWQAWLVKCLRSLCVDMARAN